MRAVYEATTTMRNNVCIGRVMNLEHLVALIGFGLPEYQIPEELLPIAPRGQARIRIPKGALRQVSRLNRRPLG